MKSQLILSLAVSSLVGLVVPASVHAAGATRMAAAIWSDGELYDTIGTPAVFMDPPEGTTDTLYNFGMSGLEGQRAISAAAPGDRDFNGGRWSVVLVTFTEQGRGVHDPDGDGVVNFELTSEEQVEAHMELGHLILTDTDVYFECPMLPRRNR